MAVTKAKRSLSQAQGRRRRAHASTKPAIKTNKTNKPIISKHGQTTTRRYPGRSFHRFEEAKGKALDYVEFFTMGEYHCVDVSLPGQNGHALCHRTILLTRNGIC